MVTQAATFSAANFQPITSKGGAGDESVSGDSGNDVVRGGDGCEIVPGNSGNDILPGGSGSDMILGGDGRDLLTFGTDSDLASGEKGEDIVITGSTIHDDHLTSLRSLSAEWSSPTPSAIRVANIRGTGSGTGLNGPTRLNASSVIDDSVADLVLGGNDIDWLFGSLGMDLFADHRKDEYWN